MKKISKKLLTIIIAAVAVVLVAAIGLTMFFVTRETEDTSALERSDKIYWNINRLNYFDQGEGGVSSRQISLEDGFFHILFSVDGRPTERRAKKASVVNKIDDNDAMGLVIDEKTRSITDVIPLEEMGAYFLYRRVYVKSIDTKKFEIVANSSATLGGKDVKIKIKSTTPVIDVSTQAMLDAGMPVKFESIEEKDQVSVIMKDDEVYGLYITKRSANLKVYWNLERQYDKAYGVTKRTPDADGVYHILTACGGEQVEIKCKDKSVVNKVDSTLCCGFDFDEEGYAIEHIAIGKCTGGRSIASWFSVDEINESTLVLHKYVAGSNDSGQDRSISLSADCEIYNVSKNFKTLQGEADEVQVGDTIQAYSDSTSKCILLFVVNRYKGGEVYWNVYRSWNSVTLQTNRKPGADGYYHYVMAKDGKTYNYKVASKALADKIDSIPARTMTLVINGDFIVGCENASGINYRSVASWFDVTNFVDSKTVHAKKTTGTNAGSETDVKFADDCKIYNVSEMYENHLGEETTLRVGDRIQCWADYKGNAKYIYVISRNYSNAVTAHRGTHNCSDCGTGVTWQPWTSATSLPTKSGHYYLCGNVVAPQTNIETNQNVVLCLNGYSIRSASTRVYVTHYEGSKLHIHDCVRSGKLYSKYQGNLNGIFGGILYARKGDISIYGGTYTAPEQTLPGNGGVIYVAEGRTVTIKNAVIEGGNTDKNGGAIFCSNGTLKIYDSTIKAGNAGGGKGDGIYLTTNSKLNIGGRVIIDGGKSNLYLSSASVAFDTPLTDGSHIAVTTISATGKVTSNYKKDSEKYFTSDTPDRVVTVSGAIFLSKEYNKETHEKHNCKDCSEDVTWTAWTNPNSLPTESGHYYLSGDITVNAQASIKANNDVVLCLNGHDIKSTAKKPIGVTNANAKLTIMDCKNKGKIYNSTSKDVYTGSGDNGRILIVGANATLNLFDVTVESPSYKSPLINGGAINVNKDGTLSITGGKIIGGDIGKSGGAIYIGPSADVSLSDVTIVAGKADDKGDAIYVSSDAKLNLKGAVIIEGGRSDKAEVYLDKSFLHFNGAVSGDSFTVATSHAEGKISDNYTQGAENKIESFDKTLVVNVKNNAIYLEEESVTPPVTTHSSHKCKDCGEDVTWTAWTSTETLPTDSGHYYLTDDVRVNGQKTVGAGKDVVICLNGHNITSTARRVYLLNGTGAKLTLMDCKESGTVSNSVKTDVYAKDGHGRLINAGSKTTLNIYDITVKSPNFKSEVNGGAIQYSSNTSGTISDAIIIGGEISGKGGAIYIGGNSDVTIKDTDILSGTADDKGNAIYVGTNTVLNLSGRVTIDNETSQVYLDGGYIHFADKLSAYSNLLVNTSNAEGKISDNYKEDAEKYVLSGKDGYTVKAKDNALYLEADIVTHTHICKTCKSEVTFTEWTDTASLPKTSGHYYLADDVTVNAQQSIGKNQDVTICLNGHNITSTARRPIGVTGENAVLTLLDCVGGGEITNTTSKDVYTTVNSKGTPTDNGRIIIIGNKATLNAYDVTIKSPTYKSPLISGGAVNINAGGTANFNGVKIIGGEIGKNGGAINIGANNTAFGKLSLCDTEIKAGAADGSGDAIYAPENTVVELSGKIIITGGDSQIFLSKGLLHFADKLSEDSEFGVTTTDTTGKLSDNYVENAETYVQSTKTGYGVIVKEGALYQQKLLTTLSNIKTSNEQKNAKLSVLSPLLNLLKEAK
ncbi:MAG: hypothetical protein IKF53_05170 [Clostridia bacterium]|nr:hypothetical protein [Clostridia bacterium]